MLHAESERAFLRPVEGRTELPGGEDVKTAVQTITKCRRSLFSYAIMSGKTEAVEYIYILVAGIFGNDHGLVREVN